MNEWNKFHKFRINVILRRRVREFIDIFKDEREYFEKRFFDSDVYVVRGSGVYNILTDYGCHLLVSSTKDVSTVTCLFHAFAERYCNIRGYDYYFKKPCKYKS